MATEPGDADDALVILCTLPDRETARRVATALVERRLAACVNLLPGAESIYRWQGRIECEEEVLAVIKTTASRYEALEKTLSNLHPYDVPEILALRVDRGLEGYLGWVKGEG